MKRSLHSARLLTARAAAMGLLLLLTLPLRAASAHSADIYLQNQSLDLAAGEIRVDWRITPGPLLAGALWDAADQNKDGAVSQEEARAWIKSILSQWTVKVDSQPLRKAQLESIAWPKFLDVLQAGDEPIDVSFAFNWPGPLAGRHRVEIHNAFEEAISLNWFSLKSETGVSFVEPAQASGSLQTDIYFQSAPSSAPALTAWESGTPNLPGLTGTLSTTAVSLSVWLISARRRHRPGERAV